MTGHANGWGVRQALTPMAVTDMVWNTILQLHLAFYANQFLLCNKRLMIFLQSLMFWFPIGCTPKKGCLRTCGRKVKIKIYVTKGCVHFRKMSIFCHYGCPEGTPDREAHARAKFQPTQLAPQVFVLEVWDLINEVEMSAATIAALQSIMRGEFRHGMAEMETMLVGKIGSSVCE